MKKKLLVLQMAMLALSGLLTVQAASAENMELVIEKTAPRSSVQIAIVPFLGAEGISGIVTNDLTSLGKFSLNSQLPEFPHSSGEVTLPAWQHKGVPYLVVGHTKANRGNVDIHFEVIEVATGRVLQGVNTVSVKNNPQSLRMAGHKIADRIYEILTGVKGDFSGKIAFVVENGFGKNKTARLYVSDVDGYNPVLLQQLQGSIFSLTPSPDGRKIAYTAVTKGYPVIYMVDIHSKQSSLLTPYKANNSDASFSPDGSRILFSSDMGGNFDIYMSSVTGGSPQRLTHDPSAEKSPSWFPDGRSYIFTSDRNGLNRPQIYRATLGMSGVQRVTNFGGYNADGRLNTDGTKMTLVSGGSGVAMDLRDGSVQRISNLQEAPRFSPNSQHLIYSNRSVISINSNGKNVSIDPFQNGVPRGQIREPIWLKATP